jgi:hypothetical protein
VHLLTLSVRSKFKRSNKGEKLMNNERFMIEVENSHNRSKLLLIKKQEEYTTGDRDRLEQFYRAGSAQAITPHSALMGMATKHFTSVSDMCKHPFNYNLKKWNSKITDLRNYTYLLDALVRDFEERSDKMIKAGE